MLDQVNGVYLAGDSVKSLTDRQYLEAFQFIHEYTESKNK